MPDQADLHTSVFKRWQALPTYRPVNMPTPLVARLNQAPQPHYSTAK
ncbi:MAG TPA: hypothetical protein IGR64_12710 [Leptolyngbyaceae cyanobacterium M65_K2018_010]|nr:hypothetical protein [Leptolyngbyaceae cyanobacterium M65_K2018_010]